MVPSDGGKVTPALFERFQEGDRRCWRRSPNTFWTDQFHNADAVDGYAEHRSRAAGADRRTIDVFCGAVGTGGMLDRRRARAARRREPRPHRRARARRSRRR